MVSGYWVSSFYKAVACNECSGAGFYAIIINTHDWR